MMGWMAPLRESTRSAAVPGGRIDSPTSVRDRRLDHPFCNRSKGSHRDHTYRLHYHRGSNADRSRREPELPRRQSHRCDDPKRRDCAEDVRTTASGGSYGDHDGRSRQPDESQCRDLIYKSAGRCATLGLELNVLRASTERDIDKPFATLIPLRVGGLTRNRLRTGGKPSARLSPPIWRRCASATLHPPRRHLQPPADRLRRARRHLQVQRPIAPTAVRATSS
jgi:hypothetical protein